MGCARPTRSGFTLLELTAVVVLMAVVASVVVPGFARRSDGAERARLISGLIDLDARARLNASRNDACFLVLDKDINQIQLTVIRDNESIVLDRVEIPDDALVSLISDGVAISFDQAGHTGAYGYEISFGTRTTRIRFNGRTGWYEIEDGDMQ